MKKVIIIFIALLITGIFLPIYKIPLAGEAFNISPLGMRIYRDFNGDGKYDIVEYTYWITRKVHKIKVLNNKYSSIKYVSSEQSNYCVTCNVENCKGKLSYDRERHYELNGFVLWQQSVWDDW